jgi:hypothetical protein
VNDATDPRHLTKQPADLGGVIHIVRRQLGRNDLVRLSIGPDMQLPPGAAGLRGLVLNQPLAGAAELQPATSSLAAFGLAEPR